MLCDICAKAHHIKLNLTSHRVSRAIPVILMFLLIPIPFSLGRPDRVNFELGVYDPCSSPSCDPHYELHRISRIGANAILVTLVDDYGRALYPSKFLPVKKDMVDLTLRTIKEARRLGLRVYGWMNIPHEIWLRRHPDWIAILSNGRPSDSYGRDYFHRIVPPSRIVREKECVDLLGNVIKEIASLGVNGIDINDNFQFSNAYRPSTDEVLLTSYDRFTVEAFEKETGVRLQGKSPVEWSSYLRRDEVAWKKWVEWRAEQVTKLVGVIVRAAREVNSRIEVRPHLLIWDPLETYGLDFSEIASVTGTLYVMIPAGESRIRHYKAVWMARQVAGRVIASTYLSDLPELSEREARRRALWIASAGADGIYVFWKGIGEERYRLMRAIFDEFRRVKEYVPPNWLKGARVVSVYAESPDQLNLEPLKGQGVSLIELDVGLSSCDRLYGDDFKRALEVVREATRRAHSLGMRVAVYIPALEVVCDREVREDWTQESLDGRRLVVRGGELNVPWMSESELDLWMSPFSPHRDVILSRVREILGAGADGIWLDVPHLPEYLTDEMSDLWPDASKWGTLNFEEEYWDEPPSSPDDSSFASWLRWRHDAALDFVLSVAEETYFEGRILMVESSACDAEGTELGFDPAFLRFNPLVVMVPEIGPPSWKRGLSGASLDDWISFYAMLKHARGSSPLKPFIPLTYGRDELDSARQLGLVISLGDGFFETNSRNGLMTGTVGYRFRKKAFWLVKMLGNLSRKHKSEIGVLFSSFSRDIVDTYVPDPYNVTGTKHMRSFRDVISVLAGNHVGFDIIPIERTTLDELRKYEVIIAPDVEVLTHNERRILSEYSGKLLVLGKLGVMDEEGRRTPELKIGERVKLRDLSSLKGFLAGLSSGIIAERFGDRCYLTSIINVKGDGISLHLPPGWVLRFDDLSPGISNGVDVIKAPKTFLLLMRGDDGGASRPKGAEFIAPPVDRRENLDLIGKYSSRFTETGTAIILGGPGSNSYWYDPDGVKFIKEGGVYSKLIFKGRELSSIYGKLDYAVIERTKCGGLSFYRVAGITRFGTRAALLWLLNRGVSREITLVKWVDDGNGKVEIREVVALGES